jgi:fanconi-associated nuclease 1
MTRNGCVDGSLSRDDSGDDCTRSPSEDIVGEPPTPAPESALPQIKSDEEAIAEYEATRAAESTSLRPQDGLGRRRWVRGKSSIYVDAFNLALETVLEDEGHLFNEAEMAVFEVWRALSYEAQYL